MTSRSTEGHPKSIAVQSTNSPSLYRTPEPVISIPTGLKGLLNDVTKEVLFGLPPGTDLYLFCAQYFEKQLSARGTFPRMEHPRMEKIVEEKINHENIQGMPYDSDSGFESSVPGFGLAHPPLASQEEETEELSEDDEYSLVNAFKQMTQSMPGHDFERQHETKLTDNHDRSLKCKDPVTSDFEDDDDGHIVQLNFGWANDPMSTSAADKVLARIELLVTRHTVKQVDNSQAYPKTTVPVELIGPSRDDAPPPEQATPIHSITSDLPPSPISLASGPLAEPTAGSANRLSGIYTTTSTQSAIRRPTRHYIKSRKL